MKRVAMAPKPPRQGTAKDGISRVIEEYVRLLPSFGYSIVTLEDEHDLVAAHAGAAGGACDVSHCHGLYWTADLGGAPWEYQTNARVVESLRSAREITVPSEWVAETLRRDMHVNPTVVPHGIRWKDWQLQGRRSLGYVLYNKNRQGDVCDATPVSQLAQMFPEQRFVSTFAVSDEPNVKVTGVLSHDKMQLLVQQAGVYLATTKETFGIGILEAMASGVPVLGYRHGGILDLIIHGESGYLAEPGNVDDLAAGLDYCYQHREKLGRNGREAAKRWGWEEVCAQVAGVYERALLPDPPTVAIIIPCYNYAGIVSGAIRSALHQTYGLITDIVVVDDGSQDDPERVVKEWRRLDPRVRFVRQENAGVATARNRGIAETHTKYVCCLDADDEIAPEFIATMVEALEADRSLGIAYSGLLIVGADGKQKPGRWPGEFNYDGQLRGDNQVPTCCVFRREAWQRSGGYRSRYAPLGCGTEDAELWLRLGALGFNARKVTTEPLFRYRMGGATTSGTGYKEVNWLEWHPWVWDRQHPFASVAKPESHSHPARQYDQPLISVVIPVGPSHEQHVIDALDSLEAQTYRNWEVVVVDDRGVPPDNWLQDAYPFARYVSTYDANRNPKGAGFSRNLGVSHVRGPLLLFLDADDWLLPQALELFLDAYSAAGDPCIVYAGSHGRRWMDEVELDAARRNELLVDDTGGIATIYQGVSEYSYELAVQQPFTQKPYFWCYVSSLLPTQWHFDVGGFDEELEAWEDWDYWIRLAKQGRWFVPQPTAVMVYNFDSGTRREDGRAEKERIRDILVEKHQEVEVMPCSGCKKRVASGPVTYPRPSYASQQADTLERSLTMQDSDFVMITYNPPRTGTHGVIGVALFANKIAVNMNAVRGGWVFNYGYRSKGDQFLAHRNDVAQAGAMFTPVEVQQAARPIRVPAATIHVNAPLQPARQAVPRVAQMVEQVDEPEPQAPAAPVPFDPQLLPGVTPAIARQLLEAGYDTPQKIAESGDALLSFRGVGPTKLELMKQAANDMLTEREPATEQEVLNEIAKILGQ